MIFLVWGGFILLVFVILAFDLGVLTRDRNKPISARSALMRTGFYFFLSVLFTVFVYFAYENHWFGLGVPPAAAVAESGHKPLEKLPVGVKKWLPYLPEEPYHIEFPFEHEDEHDEHDVVGYPDSGADAASMYFTGYLVEQSLSMDNIFVIALILSFFQVPAAYQHRVLLWGILGALLMRGVMIALGAAIITSFNWIIYVFGALLIYTAIKMAFSGEDEVDFEKSRMVRLVKRFFHVHPEFVHDHFFTKVDGRTAVTPLFIALLIVETTDLLFAVDSIPAVFGITQDPFLVFTSNIFAILGLRSLYFALAGLLDKFHHLKYSLVVVLAFVGVKMIIHDYVHISPLVSLTVIVVLLGLGVASSFIFPPPPEGDHDSEAMAT